MAVEQEGCPGNLQIVLDAADNIADYHDGEWGLTREVVDAAKRELAALPTPVGEPAKGAVAYLYYKDHKAQGLGRVEFVKQDRDHWQAQWARSTGYTEVPLYALTPSPANAVASVSDEQVEERVDRWRKASVALGAWMSAALDDPAVCDAMKDDIREWFSAGEPFEAMAQPNGGAKVEGSCDLCAGKCRGHSLGHPDQWEPEPGSRAALSTKP